MSRKPRPAWRRWHAPRLQSLVFARAGQVYDRERLFLGKGIAQSCDAPSSRGDCAGAADENPAQDHLRIISVALAPPKPNELLSAYSTLASIGLRKTGKPHVGSWVSKVEVGGNHPPESAIKQITVSTAPAAPRR
jgi:hypothetical protein